MPKGVKGFQPGREKTGGMVAAPIKAMRNSKRLIDRLKGYGFDYAKELATALRGIRDGSSDPTKVKLLLAYYDELKALLPYMAPKLKEKEVSTTDDETPAFDESQISSDDLLKAINGEQQTKDNKRASAETPVEQGNISVQVSASSETNLPDVGGEPEED